MKRFSIMVLLLVPLVLSQRLSAAPDSIKVTFDRNEGMAAWDRIVRIQGDAIAAMVGSQLADSTSIITVISNADGVQYRTNHQKQNTVMTEERAVTATTLLEYYCADLSRVRVVPLMNQADTGSEYRYIIFKYASHRPGTSATEPFGGSREAVREHERRSDIAPIRPTPPVSTPPAKSTPDTCCTYTALWLGTGLNYSPLEKVLPHIQAEWGTERLRLIAAVSYSVYQEDKNFAGDELQVSYRSVAGGIAWQAVPHSQFDLVALWQRNEEYAVDYGRYARKLEGPAIGIRLQLTDYLEMTGLWTPSEEQVRGRDEVVWDTGKMYLGLSAFIRLTGGDR